VSASVPVTTPRWSPWRSVVAFGLVSLLADMVYEGMRAVAGPFLGTLGASALTVGLVTGAGEAAALALRLVAGPLADRTGNHWRPTVLGYALTAVCVPLLAVTPFLGTAGLGVAVVLVLAERTGKAVRSPSKSALLAGIAVPVGRGRGFAVHKALDQVGAVAGPLLVAGVAVLAGGAYWPGFLLLALPGAAALVLLALLRQRAPVADPPPRPRARTASWRSTFTGLPRSFRLLALACAASTVGLMTFGVVSFALVQEDVVRPAVVPVLYAAAMAVEAVAALGAGLAYDRIGPGVLLAVPVLVVGVPALVFSSRLAWVLAGLAAWAVATAVQDSTVKALVADLVDGSLLGTAYGVLAAAQGVAALVGGTLAGALYADRLGLLVVLVAVLQVVALAALVTTVRRDRRDPAG
jgi:MFS family permease